MGWLWWSLGVALGWLWGAYRLAINRLWGGFDVALMWLWGRIGCVSAFILHPSAFAPVWLRVALVGNSRFEVRGSKFGVDHKPSEYNSPPARTSGWSGGTLDKPWTYPGTIEPSQRLVFDQPHLSNLPHPPLRRLCAARTDGVLPVAPRCSSQEYPV